MTAESRTEELRTVIKQVRDGEFDYNSREPPITNWNLYDNAQIKEFRPKAGFTINYLYSNVYSYSKIGA